MSPQDATAPLPPAAARLVARHALVRHPEGGWYRRVVESASRLETPRGPRPALTSILYLLAGGECSRPHRVCNDEAWHFLDGSPLRLVDVAGGACRETVLGGKGASVLAHLVPAGAWQAAESLGEWSLAGCTVAPGFDYADFEIAAGDTLAALLAAAPVMARFAR